MKKVLMFAFALTIPVANADSISLSLSNDDAGFFPTCDQ